MDDTDRRVELAQRLSDASNAHSKFQTEELGGVYDQQWPEWYAAYLLDHSWNTAFTHVWSLAELTEGLRRADVEHRANAPQQVWQDYYAGYFLTNTN